MVSFQCISSNRTFYTLHWNLHIKSGSRGPYYITILISYWLIPQWYVTVTRLLANSSPALIWRLHWHWSTGFWYSIVFNSLRLFGNNPLSEPMMVYCQLDPKEHITMKFYFKLKSFHSRTCIWKYRLKKMVAILFWPECVKWYESEKISRAAKDTESQRACSQGCELIHFTFRCKIIWVLLIIKTINSVTEVKKMLCCLPSYFPVKYQCISMKEM